ncbi:MAG: shikimate dehydrogenase [Betaproteobacteria bacterium]
MLDNPFILPSGTTDLYVILGDPIAQVQAPATFNDIFRRAQRDAVMVALKVTAADLAATFAGLKHIENLRGISLAIPHKGPMLALADDASEMARIVGATNAVRRNADGRWFADMFDGMGFVNGLTDAGHMIKGRNALLVGAGGGGSAIAAALLQQGVGHLRIADIDADRVTAFVARLAARWPGRVTVAASADPANADLVINASPMGLRPDDPIPIDPTRLDAGALVADIIMKPPETALLKAATARGNPTHRGILMFAGQIRPYADFYGFADSLASINWRDDEFAAQRSRL